MVIEGGTGNEEGPKEDPKKGPSEGEPTTYFGEYEVGKIHEANKALEVKKALEELMKDGPNPIHPIHSHLDRMAEYKEVLGELGKEFETATEEKKDEIEPHYCAIDFKYDALREALEIYTNDLRDKTGISQKTETLQPEKPSRLNQFLRETAVAAAAVMFTAGGFMVLDSTKKGGRPVNLNVNPISAPVPLEHRANYDFARRISTNYYYVSFKRNKEGGLGSIHINTHPLEGGKQSRYGWTFGRSAEEIFDALHEYGSIDKEQYKQMKGLTPDSKITLTPYGIDLESNQMTIRSKDNLTVRPLANDKNKLKALKKELTKIIGINTVMPEE